MASILFDCEKFKLKIPLCFDNFLCWTLFCESPGAAWSMPKSCLADSTHQKTTGSLEDDNRMRTSSMLSAHIDEFWWIPLLWFEWLLEPLRCTFPTGDPGEWTMCCHLFQCLALVHLQTLKESPGPCTAVAEMQACNPSPAVDLGVFQKGLNSQLRLNPSLFASSLLRDCDNQIPYFVYQWHHWRKYFHDWCPEIPCDPFFPH